MKKFKTLPYTALLLSVILSACVTQKSNNQSQLKGYAPVSKDLYDTIASMDSVLFDAFNSHDLNKLGNFFASELEFYHDKGGLTFYNQTMQNFGSLFEKNKTTGLRRDLVKGSLEVYPIKDFGAVEICLHTFCHVENGKNDCGTFKNVMLWQKKKEGWKITRIISYDH